jgi:uncharacterized protein (TIGR03083 family)
VEITEHIDILTEQARLFGAAAQSAGLNAPVPSCPDWVVRDLVRHQGGVHRWAASIVGLPRTEPWNVDLPEVVGSWPPDEELLSWFADGAASLIQVLRDADPGLVCWAFLSAPSPLAMWARRQAHETSVHRVDAELAARAQLTAVEPQFAADGIDELLSCFITRRRTQASDGPPVTLGVRCADIRREWLVSVYPDSFETRTSGAETGSVAEGIDAASCVVSGLAADLYLSLWRRRSPDVLTVGGERSILNQFLDRVQVTWS